MSGEPFDLSQFSDERLNIVYELAAGNGEPLARHLEAGGELFEEQRETLIKYLRKEVKVKRGNRRTYSQIKRDNSMHFKLCALQWNFALRFGAYKSYTRAIDAYAEMHPEIGRETIRKCASGGLLKQAWLDALDRAHKEATLNANDLG